MKNFLPAVLLAVLLTGCYSGNNVDERLNATRMKDFTFTSSPEQEVLGSSVYQINPSHVEKGFVDASEIYKNRSYIELKTPSGVILGDITKMKISNGLILVLDERISKSAYLFDSNGDYMFKVGRKGGGPGEHDDPIDIEFKGERIFLVDRSFNIYEYDLKNQFIAKQQIPFFSHSMYVFDNDEMAFSNNTTGYEDLSYQIIFIDGQEIIKRHSKNIGKAISGYTSQPLTNNRAIHGDSFLFFKPWDTKVYQMSNNQVELRYEIVTDNPIPQKILENSGMLLERELKHTFIYNWPILETENLAIMRVLDKGKITTLIHNKEKDMVRGYSGMSDDLLYGGISDFPIYANGNDFYVPLMVEQLYEVKQELSKITDKKLLAELREARPEVFKLMESINEISNPILMKCEIQ